MASREEKRTENKRGSRPPANPWLAIDMSEWILRLMAIAVIVALPWHFGFVQWKSQYFLGWLGVALSIAIGLHCMVSFLSRSRDLSVPWLTWLFILFGLVAWVQSQPIFTWQGDEPAPPSVQIQRWALGLAEAPRAIQATIFNTKTAEFKTQSSDSSASLDEVPCDLKNVPEAERRLAWSIEPLHTRGAAMSLFLCGLFVWVGRLAFSDSNKQLWLYGTLTLIGILIACVGIRGAISYESLNFLGLKTGSSFATFVSKNSAGGFLNICIAGCLGLLGWTLLNTQRSDKDIRYRFPDKSAIAKIRGFAEDTLADLNTSQITAMLCLIGIVAALLISLCRGAAVSAFGAILIAAFVANARSRSRGNWIIAVAVVIGFIACMVGFQVDDKAYSRLESLSELDVESELREGRAYIWSIAWKAMSFYGWLGSGLGTFHFAYLPFQHPSSPGWFYHAESLYAQCGVELGYLGVSVLILAIFAIISELQRAPAKENWGLAFPSKLAGTYLVISQALHSFVDFAIILPALFVPACVLIGSVQGTLQSAQIAPVRKRSRSDGGQAVRAAAPKSVAWLRNCFIGVFFSMGCGFAIVMLLDSVKSLATADSMVSWTKIEEKKSLELQTSDRVIAMAKIWAGDNALLKENSIAMREFADSLLFDYRMNQMIAARPASAWSQSWSNTSPVFYQIALDRTQDPMRKEQIIEAVGGTKAIDILGRSATWYALGQTKSPLDWQLLWGRCLTNVQCNRNDIARLLPASLTMSQHNAQQLLATSVLFRDKLEHSQFDGVLSQAMKSNPGSAVNAAKLLAMERKDKEVSIEMFPQRSDILQAVAMQTFTKANFPETNRLLWERAAELIVLAPMTESRRQKWLADCSEELGDVNGEITHLRLAIGHEPMDLNLQLRLANRLIETLDMDGAKKVLQALQRLDPADTKVKAIAERISKI